MLVSSALVWGTSAIGAHESRSWAAAPFWLLSFSAAWVALPAVPANRATVSVYRGWPGRLLLGVVLTLAWFALAVPPRLDRWMYSGRLLSLTSATGLGVACFLLARGRREGIRPLVRTVLGIGLFQTGLGIVQGPGCAGTYANHAHFVGLLEVVFPFAAAQWMDRDQGLVEKGLAGVVGAGTVVAVLLARSSGGAFAFLVIATYLAAVFSRRRVARAGTVGLAASILVAAGMGLVSSQDAWKQELQQLDPSSIQFHQRARLALWGAAVGMVEEHPVTGVGLGGYRSAFPRWRPMGLLNVPRNAHNDFLQFAAEGGVVGGGLALALFLLALGGLHATARSAPRGRRRRYSYAAAAGCLGFGVHGLFDFNAQIPANLGILAACVGGALGCTLARRRCRGSPGTFSWQRPMAAGLGLLGILLLAAHAVQVLRYETSLRRGLQQVGSGRVLAGVVDLESAARRMPGASEAWFHLARAHLQASRIVDEKARAGHQQRAIACASQGGKAGTGAQRAELVVAEAMLAMGEEPRLVARRLEEAVATFPNDPLLLLPLASVRAGIGEKEGAADALGGALRSYPPDKRPVSVVEALAREGRTFSWLEGALPEDFGRGFAVLARASDGHGDKKEADRLWERVLKASPEDVELRLERARFLMKVGKFEPAREDLEFARRWRPEDSSLALDLLHVLEQLGQAAQAEDLLAKSLRAWPDQLEWRLEAAERLRDQGDAERTREVFEKLAKDHPKRLEGPLLLGKLIAAEGRRLDDRGLLREAAKHLREARRRAPREVEPRSLLASLYIELGDIERSLPIIEGLRSEGDLTPEQAFVLGVSSFNQARYGAASELFQRAHGRGVSRRLGGKSLEEWSLRAVVRRAMERVEAAQAP